MIALLRGELIKVRTTRTALGFGAAAVLLVLAIVLVSNLAGDPETINDKRDTLNIGGALSVPLLLFGIVGATGEFRHRTLAPAVLIAPDRLRLDFARIAAYVLTALLVGIGMLAVALLIGLPLLSGQPGPDLAGEDYTKLIVGGLVTAALCAALGVGIGILVRNQVAGVVGALVWLFILEPVASVIDEDFSKYTVLGSAGAAGGSVAEDTLPWASAIGVLALWAAAFIIVGLLVDRRRDVD